MRNIIDREQPFQVLATNFSIGPSSSGYDLQISADGVNYTTLFSVGANVTRMVTGVASGSFYKLSGNTDEGVVVNWQRQCNDGQGGGGEGTGPQGPMGPQGNIGPIGPQGPQGPAGEGGSGEGVVYVNHLSDAAAVSAEVGTLIVLNEEEDDYQDHSIYIKVEGGEVASWNGYVSSNQDTPMEVIYDNYEDFVDFADGEVLFAFKYRYGSDYRYVSVNKDEGAIILYSDDTLSTEITRATYLGNEVTFDSANQSARKVAVQWKEDEITLRITNGYIDTKDLMDFSTEGVHYHRITDPTKATASNLGMGNTTQTGFPIWNNEGVIVGRDSEKKNKGVQINYGSNTYTNVANIVCTSGEGALPTRMYVPTEAGTQGQVLTFAGENNAPVWSTMIKAVQITSAAYEALVTKDPNTLYLIVD